MIFALSNFWSNNKLIFEDGNRAPRAKIYFWRAEPAEKANNYCNCLVYERAWTLQAEVRFVLLTEISDESMERQRLHRYFLSEAETCFATEQVVLETVFFHKKRTSTYLPNQTLIHTYEFCIALIVCPYN